MWNGWNSKGDVIAQVLWNHGKALNLMVTLASFMVSNKLLIVYNML